MTSPTVANEHVDHICDNPRCELTSNNKSTIFRSSRPGWLIIDLEIHDVVADLDVTVDDRIVTIKVLPRVDAPATPVRITGNRRRSTMERVIELPNPVDMGRKGLIKATLLDDVLRLVLPTMNA